MAIKVVTKDMLAYYHEKAEAQDQAQLATKVDKVEGKGLSTNDYTNTEKSKLAGIADGAQVNVLEGVQVNGADVAIADKKVNIDLSAYAVKSQVETALAGKVDKADGMGLMSDAEKAKIANLADNANATYATKAELSAIPKFGLVLVDALPDTGESDKIYLVPNEGSGTNSRDEFIFVNGAWELIGTTEVDISGKADKTYVDEELRKVNDVIASLDIPEGVIVDSALDASSTNAIQNKVVTDALATKAVKSEVESALALKADKTYVDAEVEALEGAIATKANASDVYTKTEIDGKVTTLNNAIGLKADASAVYTKAEVDSAIDADVAVVNNRVTTEVATLNGAIDAVDAKFADYVLATDIEVITTAEIDAMFV